jgi:hypothetical protein
MAKAPRYSCGGQIKTTPLYIDFKIAMVGQWEPAMPPSRKSLGDCRLWKKRSRLPHRRHEPRICPDWWLS